MEEIHPEKGVEHRVEAPDRDGNSARDQGQPDFLPRNSIPGLLQLVATVNVKDRERHPDGLNDGCQIAVMGFQEIRSAIDENITDEPSIRFGEQ